MGFQPIVFEFLKLDENGQMRAIDTLLSATINIDELLPIALRLRKSPNEAVKLMLKKELIELVQACTHHLVEMVKKVLDPGNSKEDNILLNELEEVYALYERTNEMRSVKI